MFVFIASLWWFVCCFTGYFNTLCVLFNSKSSARVQHVSFLPADITRGTCCLKFNTQHVLFCLSTLRLLRRNSMRRVLFPTRTTCWNKESPRQHTLRATSNTLVYWIYIQSCVILPSLCKNNTWDEIQMLLQHMLHQTTHDGDTHAGYFFNMAVFAAVAI